MLGWCGFISGERSIITKYIDVIVRVFHYFEVSVSMVPQTKKNGTCPMSTFNSADSGSYILIKLKRITFKEHYYNGNYLQHITEQEVPGNAGSYISTVVLDPNLPQKK